MPGPAPAAGLAVFFLALSLFVASRSTLWDRDEPRFARTSSEMAASRNYLVPTFGGAVRPDKPILVYWLQCISIRIFGRSEVAIRFWSAAAAAGAGLATWEIGRTLFTPAVGLRAMAVLLTSPLLLLEAGAATADALLLLCTTAAMLAVARVLRGPARALDFLLFSAAAALGLLTKGPVGLAIPVLSAGTILAFGRREVASRGRLAGLLLLASAASLAVFLAWFLPADRAAGGLLWKEGFGRHVAGRMLHPMEGHGGPMLLTLPYYLPVVLLGFSPWLLFLPVAIRDLAAGNLGGDRGRIFLAAWIVPNFLLFSLVATKLPHYVLPVFPALALAVGAEIEAAAAKSSGESDRARVWLRGGAWLFGTTAAAETGLLVAAIFRLPPPLKAPAGALAAVIAASSGAVPFFFRRRLPSAAARAAFAGVVGAQIVLGAALLPALEPFKPAPFVARAVRAAFPAGVGVATLGFAEPSLDFYLDGPPIRRLASVEEISRWSAERGPGVLVTTREDLARIPSAARLGLIELASRRGLNYSKGRWIELVALRRPEAAGKADR